MAILELNIYSISLGTQQQVCVVMPQEKVSGETEIDSKENNFKCMYLLHGLGDNHSTWLRRTSIERYAQEYGLCVVMPFGERSFYTDMKNGGKYYTYIAKELPEIMQQMFSISSRREDNVIAGNSMGGYGALEIGMRECQAFGAVAGLSSVADITEGKEYFRQDMINIFGEEMEIPTDADLFSIAKECNKNPLKPRVYMTVGTDDFLFEANQRLRDCFLKLDYDYTYNECEGDHCWEFWDRHIQNIIKWIFDGEN